MTIALKKMVGGLLIGLAFAGQAMAAAAPSFVLSGAQSPLALSPTGANSFDVALPTGFSFANATKNSFLSLSSAADLVFTFVGKEAAYNNVFKDYTSNTHVAGSFSNNGSVANSTTFSTHANAGSLTFSFFSNGSTNSVFSNGNSRIGVILSSNKQSALLMFNDTASDKDYDDMVVKVSILSAVPEPETYALMLGGLAVVGAVARRRKQQA